MIELVESVATEVKEKWELDPDIYMADIATDLDRLSESVHGKIADLVSKSGELRKLLLEKEGIIDASEVVETAPLKNVAIIDGAKITHSDRSSSYIITCSSCISQEKDVWKQSSCCARVPHSTCLESTATGLMMMQEVMMAVEVAEEDPGVFVFIDGSRISSLIHIHSFYSNLKKELGNRLDIWRNEAIQQGANAMEPARTFAKFESRDWVTPYLMNPRIVGNLKLVTTTGIVEEYLPEFLSVFDDKTVANALLMAGERTARLPVFNHEKTGKQKPQAILSDSEYPFREEVAKTFEKIVKSEGDESMSYVYYRPFGYHSAYKIEFSNLLLSQQGRFEKLLRWWYDETDSVTSFEEPYRFFLVDLQAKKFVTLGKDILTETFMRRLAEGDENLAIGMSYRSQ